MADTICDGLTVLEMGNGSVPAAAVGMMLADNGARVVKLERPGGDPLRRDLPAAWLVWNRGKESVVVDLRTAEGRSEVLALAAGADVVVEAFAPGVAAGWGVGADDLTRANPALVHCSIKGFGSHGRYAGIPAYEGVIAAKAGIFGRGDFGFRNGPVFSGAFLASTGASNMATSGILAALIAREATGTGQRVEATLYQGLNPHDYFGVMSMQYAQRLQQAPVAAPGGSGMMVVSRYGLMPCTKDGRWIVFSPQLPHQAHALLRAVGLEHTLEDPRYAKASVFDSAEDAQAWEDMIWESIRTKTLDEWLPIFLAEPDLPFEIARSSEEALDHPQIVDRGNSIVVEDPTFGPIRQVGPVANFAKTPSVIVRSAPALGEHADRPATRPAVTGGGPTPEHPLAGVTIVEFGYFYAMPYAVTMAAALGARVIKLEGLEGDPMRRAFGPETGAVKVMEGKESVAVDLKSDEGRTIAHKLFARANAFVLGFRPGVAERLGIDYETLAAINPRIVFLHASAYGSAGPYAKRPLYAQAAQAMAGNHHRQAGFWMAPERGDGYSVPELQVVIAPRLRSPIDGDSNSALAACSALLFALAHQARTGEGQFIETSMINGNLLAYADDANSYAGKPPPPGADPEQLGLHALYRLYPAAEGWVFLAAPRQREWESLVASAGRPDLAGDPRFATDADRRAHDDDLAGVLTEIFATKAAAEWEGLLVGAGVGCVEVFEGGQTMFTLGDPALREAGLVVEVEHPSFGSVLRAGPPVTFSETPPRVAGGCLLGQHTEAVLLELGYTAEEIDALEAQGVVQRHGR
jgi:crotonobetainyl-CoA:carnitine CoA-transferase CaiB-like acyl-CoA transferase